MTDPGIFDEYASRYDEAVNASIRITGDTVQDFARIKAEHIRGQIGAAKDVRILDFGCGVGVTTRALAAAFGSSSRVVGSDPSIESINTARRESTVVDVEFVHQPDDHLSFSASAFDVVMASCVFHHIPRALREKWLIEIRRVLSPAGRLFLFEHNPLNPLTRRAVKACPFDEGVELLGPWEARAELSRAGFRTEGPRFYYFFPRILSRLRRLEPALRSVPLGAQYYVIGSA